MLADLNEVASGHGCFRRDTLRPSGAAMNFGFPLANADAEGLQHIHCKGKFVQTP
jgi:hypothetical protein